MNGRIIKAALAGVGALALVGGATTYAAFTDTHVVEAQKVSAAKFSAGAAVAGSSTGGALVPGGAGVSQDFLVTGAGFPTTLSVRLANLVDRENGCDGDEVEVDLDCNSNIGKLGDLANEAVVTAVAYPVSATTGRCAFQAGAPGTTAGKLEGSAPTSPRTITTTTTTSVGTGTSTAVESFQPAEGALANVVNGPQTFTFGSASELPANGKTCVRITLALPKNATNAVQGDTASFDVRLQLAQKV